MVHGDRTVALPPIEEALRCPLLDRDPEAWLRCCTARFLPLARRLAGDDATARDALQASWIIVLEKLYQYRGGTPACGWVGAIVRHESGHSAKRTNREVPLQSDGRDSSSASPQDVLHRRQLVRILLEAIDHLPPTYREVVRLRDIQDRSVADVARELHISRSNVAVRLHRAHRLLRRRLVRLLGKDG
ncbi:MAG: sigma-70 family RNA polymerase sigma factor [Acidobacteria bacterium]|nr:sigma-70 family RNA polymerase sigma factor [Acidobacteriota bacterium]